LLPASEYYLTAFWELNSDRQIGMGLGPIPFTSIDRYALRHSIAGDDFDFFQKMIRAMDRVFIEHAKGNAPDVPGNSGGKPKLNAREMTPEMFDAVFG